LNDYFTNPFNDVIFISRVNAHLNTRQLIKNEKILKQKLMSFSEKLAKKV